MTCRLVALNPRTRGSRLGALLWVLWLIPVPAEAQAPEGNRPTVHLTGSWASEIAAPFELREDVRAWGLRAEFDWRRSFRPYVGASRASLGVDCLIVGAGACPEPRGWLLVAGGSVDVLPDHVRSPLVPYLGAEVGALVRSRNRDAAWAAVAGLRIPVHRQLSLTGELRRARLDPVIDQHWQVLGGVRVSW